MRLVRNITPDGSCKYAAVRNDKVAALPSDEYDLAIEALQTLQALGVLENPKVGDSEEFFLIKLKDENAAYALLAYANAICRKDIAFARDITELVARSLDHPTRKQPD
jgi:hypothetical protein